MRLIFILPYRTPAVNLGFVSRDFVTNGKKNGQLKGIEVDIDEGLLIESTSATRDEEVPAKKHSVVGLTEEDVANVTVGIIKKAREYSEMGKYDAIVCTGGLDPGFAAVRQVSKIPVAFALHSSVHVASLIGERFSIIQGAFSSALMMRHGVERYGLGHKLASVRCYEYSVSYVQGFISKYKKDERIKVPEGKELITDITAQCITAIEKDRVDSLVFPSEPTQVLAAEVRQMLDEAGYDEIPIICGLPAAVAVVKAMVEMKLLKTPRAYPTYALRAKPEYW
ncbi:aspartate/glutamate racemase family protein [Chloroflexota bacterium]